jgi:hypothetical protein
MLTMLASMVAFESGSFARHTGALRGPSYFECSKMLCPPCLLQNAISPMSPDIRNLPLVSTLVTSPCWMIVRRKKLQPFGQHWPAPVPPQKAIEKAHGDTAPSWPLHLGTLHLGARGAGRTRGDTAPSWPMPIDHQWAVSPTSPCVANGNASKRSDENCRNRLKG